MLAVAFVGILATAAPAGATWSVVATDQQTGEVGVAIASCVQMSALGDLSQPLPPVILVPNKGAAVTQAFLNREAAWRIRELIEIGRTPEEILGDITTAEFDEQFEQRQHGIVTFSGQPASFTGSATDAATLDLHSPGVSVQGNLLVSEAVAQETLAAFEGTVGQPLSDRLVAALVAGAAEGGDNRCGEQTALFAHLAVASPDDEAFKPSVMITIAKPLGGQNPVDALAAAHARGETTLIDVPSQEGEGGGLGLIALLLGVIMVPAGALYWRWAYRKPRY